MKRASGFTVLELLIVVAILMVLAAICIPSYLAARARADKASAINSLRVIQSGELDYSGSLGKYTNQLSALNIPLDLQQGQKSGYRFVVHSCRRQSFDGGCFVVIAFPMRQSKYLNFRTDSMCADETGFLSSTSAFSCD